MVFVAISLCAANPIPQEKVLLKKATVLAEESLKKEIQKSIADGLYLIVLRWNQEDSSYIKIIEYNLPQDGMFEGKGEGYDTEVRFSGNVRHDNGKFLDIDLHCKFGKAVDDIEKLQYRVHTSVIVNIHEGVLVIGYSDSVPRMGFNPEIICVIKK
jgi:hypothetical protein